MEEEINLRPGSGEGEGTPMPRRSGRWGWAVAGVVVVAAAVAAAVQLSGGLNGQGPGYYYNRQELTTKVVSLTKEYNPLSASMTAQDFVNWDWPQSVNPKATSAADYASIGPAMVANELKMAKLSTPAVAQKYETGTVPMVEAAWEHVSAVAYPLNQQQPWQTVSVTYGVGGDSATAYVAMNSNAYANGQQMGSNYGSVDIVSLVHSKSLGWKVAKQDIVYGSQEATLYDQYAAGVYVRSPGL
ncbi:MAG: hypothetical protein ACYCRD_04925 [Leptospirillum sp.]